MANPKRFHKGELRYKILSTIAAIPGLYGAQVTRQIFPDTTQWAVDRATVGGSIKKMIDAGWLYVRIEADPVNVREDSLRVVHRLYLTTDGKRQLKAYHERF